MKVVKAFIYACGAILIAGLFMFGKKWYHCKKHGTPPGTYEVNMEDWD